MPGYLKYYVFPGSDVVNVYKQIYNNLKSSDH